MAKLTEPLTEEQIDFIDLACTFMTRKEMINNLKISEERFLRETRRLGIAKEYKSYLKMGRISLYFENELIADKSYDCKKRRKETIEAWEKRYAKNFNKCHIVVQPKI